MFHRNNSSSTGLQRKEFNSFYLSHKSHSFWKHRVPTIKEFEAQVARFEKKNSHVCYYTHMHGLIYFHTYGIIVQHTILYYTILYTILQVDGQKRHWEVFWGIDTPSLHFSTITIQVYYTIHYTILYYIIYYTVLYIILYTVLYILLQLAFSTNGKHTHFHTSPKELPHYSKLLGTVWVHN